LSKSAKIRTRAAEFDLHRKLVINKQGMSNYDILTLQSETAKRHIEFAIKTEFKIVFLSMVWARSAQSRVRFLLGRYDNIDFRKVIIKNMVRVPPRSSLNKTVNKSLIVLKKGPVCNYKWDLCLFLKINRT
jgi:hypothetical protein